MCRKHSLPALGWAKIHEERDISIGILEKYPLESTWAAVCCQDWSELQEVSPVHASMPHELHDCEAMFEVNVEPRASELPKHQTTTTIHSEGTSPEPASHKTDVCVVPLHSLMLRAPEGSHWVGQHCPLPNSQAPASTNQLPLRSGQQKVEKGMEKNRGWIILTAYEFTCFYFPETCRLTTLFPSLSYLNQHSQLSAPPALSQAIRFINLLLSSPSLASAG